MKIVFLGGGNMATALIGGMIKQGAAPSSIQVIEKAEENCQRLTQEFGVECVAAADRASLHCDVMVLAVKPQQMREAVAPLAGKLESQLVVSIAAGLRLVDIRRWLDGHKRLVRAMPNTPALIGAGVTGLYAPSSVSKSERQAAESIMAAVGSTLWVDDEGMMDAVTAISGSEPAAFSLASAPHCGRELELHILAREDSSRTLLAQLQHDGMARIQLPFGDTHLAELPEGPLVLIAAGTGMAQMHSLIEHCRAAGFKYPVHLYWGARTAADFYELPHWQEWQTLTNLRVQRVVSDDPLWPGRKGLLHAAVREDFADLKPLHVYASGSPGMVYATLDALVEAGMDAQQMRADVFAYAPRG